MRVDVKKVEDAKRAARGERLSEEKNEAKMRVSSSEVDGNDAIDGVPSRWLGCGG